MTLTTERQKQAAEIHGKQPRTHTDLCPWISVPFFSESPRLVFACWKRQRPLKGRIGPEEQVLRSLRWHQDDTVLLLCFRYLFGNMLYAGKAGAGGAV
jgi:hypothetical protein